jgi:hypothetical protein
MIVDGTTTTELDLSASSPSCASVNGGRACTISVAAPIGTDTFTLLLFDGMFTNGQHTGTEVGAASNFAVTVSEGAANVSTPLIVGGIPATADIAAAGLTGRTTATVPLIVTAYDADGNIIVGPADYVDAAGTPTPLVVRSQIASSQVTLADGMQSGTSISVAGPSDSPTVSLGSPATILGIPFSATLDGVRIAPRHSQTAAVGGTLSGTIVATLEQMPDYTAFAPMNTTMASGITNGFIFVLGSESNGGIVGYFDTSSGTAYTCTVSSAYALTGPAAVAGGIAVAYSAGLFTDTTPWGITYLTLAQLQAGGTCPAGTQLRTDTVNQGVAKALVYDSSLGALIAGTDSGGGADSPSLISYPITSGGTISAGTALATGYASAPNTIIDVNGTHAFQIGGAQFYAQSGASAPSTLTVAGANITSLTTGYDQHVYALNASGHTIVSWDGTSSTTTAFGTLGITPSTQPWSLAMGPDGSAYAVASASATISQLSAAGAAQSITMPTTNTPAYLEALFDGHDGFVYAVLDDGSSGNTYIDRLSH